MNPSSKALLFHAYDIVVERSARLSPLATKSAFSFESEDVENKRTSLAIDDLISLAINGRRLISIMGDGFKKNTSKVKTFKFHFTPDDVHLKTNEKDMDFSERFLEL